MGTFQPNKRRRYSTGNHSAIQKVPADQPKDVSTVLPTLRPSGRPSTPQPILRSTPHPSTPLTTTPFQSISRLPHNIEAIHEFDKLVNYLIQHRPHAARPFITDCWELYNKKYSKKKTLTKSAPSQPKHAQLDQTDPPIPSAGPPNLTPQSTQPSHVQNTSEAINIINLDSPSTEPCPDTATSNDDHSPTAHAPTQQALTLFEKNYHPNIPLLSRQFHLEKAVYERWNGFVKEQDTTPHTQHADQKYIVRANSNTCENPVVLDAKNCCMALLDANSQLSDVHLNALKFLWFNLIEDTCTGAVFNHGIGYPRTHIIFLFAQLVITSPNRGKNKILIICPPSSLSQWEMSSEPFDSIHIDFLTMSRWHENISQWRERGGVLIASEETYYNILIQPSSPDKRAALAALCSPGPDVCILDEASRTNTKSKKPLLRRMLNRTGTKSRLALTSVPLAGFITRAWSTVDWACPCLFGTSLEYQWRFVDPIVRGHRRDATPEEAGEAFKKACLLYNKMGMVTFTVDSNMRKEALLSKGLSLHESVVWVNLSREEYGIYRDVERLLSKAVMSERLSPYLACDLLICAASSVHALRRTLHTWAEADPEYLESIGHRKTFSKSQECLRDLLSTVEALLREGLICTKMQLALLLGRQCLLKNERLVIFASSQELFEDVHLFLDSNLDKTKVHTYNSASLPKVKTESLESFNTAQDGAILVAPYGPTSHCMEESGWGFVNATRVLFVDSSWHSGACVQAVNRVHNFAQLNSEAHIHHFLAQGTVELALSSVLDWRYNHLSSCDSSTLPASISNDLDERGFLLAPELSPHWIRDDPPSDLPRSEPNVKRLDPKEQTDSCREHEELILPLQKIEDITSRDKCVHEIVLNSKRYESLSENLDLCVRAEWSRKRRFLRGHDNESARVDAVKSHVEALHWFGGERAREAQVLGATGFWSAPDCIFKEEDSSVCHLLSSWEPYLRLYERSVDVRDPLLRVENRGVRPLRPEREENAEEANHPCYHEA